MNFINIHYPNITQDIRDKCIKEFTDTIKNINDEKMLKETLEKFEKQENIQHMIFTYINESKTKGTSKTQGTSKIHDELELQKTLREEEERKKTQEERNVDSLIRQYYEQKALKGVTIEFFLKQTEKECIEKYKSLSKDQFNEKMKEMDNYFQIFKTKIAENEMFPGTSSEIEIPKIDKTKLSRFYLTLLSADKYREKRTEEMKKRKRFMKAKNASTDEIDTAGLMTENQIERFSIIKEEELIRKK